ncbi:MAG: FeoB-associated Cys-rich membrane protein [Syntrophomonadaceae bacterium]|nr:FeoB-associated Cys-rich membrane protein [Syntrophomonadaceae bacterium]
MLEYLIITIIIIFAAAVIFFRVRSVLKGDGCSGCSKDCQCCSNNEPTKIKK